MPESLLLGVDGGGTKTEFVLLDRAGHVAGIHQEAGSYYLQIGLDGLRQVLGRGINAILGKLSISADALEHAFFGLPAYGEDSMLQPVLDALPSALLGHNRYRCGNDMLCTWAGSLGGSDGVGIVAGTGSIGYGERLGLGSRAGGWGELFSDEGSAFWIATAGFNAFSRMADGRLPRGPLYEIVRTGFGLTSDLDLGARVAEATGSTRDRIASYCPLVAQAATEDDAQARSIFELAGRELAGMAGAIRISVGFVPGERVLLSYAGGVFSTGQLVLAPFRRALADLSQDFVLCEPLLPPGVGAALYAARDCGHPLDAKALEALGRCSALQSNPRVDSVGIRK